MSCRLFPADVLWNLAMAINVYLTVFRKYNAAELRALEWRYLVACYGFPFIWSLILVFIKTESRGRIFGPATIWCWISIEWNFMRFVCTYGPAWCVILVAFTNSDDVLIFLRQDLCLGRCHNIYRGRPCNFRQEEAAEGLQLRSRALLINHRPHPARPSR